MQLLWIRSSLLAKIIVEVENNLPFETGGMLIGYKDHYRNFAVTDSISAGQYAQHGKGSFIPDGTYQQMELTQHYFNSERLHTYLGDWHSHPYNDSYLSTQDLETLQKIAETKSARTPNPIFMIIGTDPIRIKAWRYNKNNLHEQLIIRLY